MLRTNDDARFWNGVARKYAASHIKDLAGYERTIERCRHFLTASDTVHEVGCGTGTTALQLAGSVAHVVGSDVSPEMIAIAREKSLAQGCRNARFEVAAADDMPGPDATCDAVLAFNLLHLIADRPSTLARIRRRLKPGGVLITKTPCLSEMSPIIRLAVPMARMAGKAPYVSFFNAASLAAELEAAGFTLTAQERHGSGRKDARIFLVGRKIET